MATDKIKSEKVSATDTPSSAMASCRKKKNEEATFLEDLKDHIDKFIHASIDEHKTCFLEDHEEGQSIFSKHLNQKMFGMSKVVAERRNVEAKEGESFLPLRTTLSE